MCVYAPCMPSGHGGQKRALYLLELEVVSHHVGAGNRIQLLYEGSQ